MLSQYLMFNEDCAEALAAYEKAFGAKITEMKRYSDVPAGSGFIMDEGQKDLVLNAMVEIDGAMFMCADSGEARGIGRNMYMSYMNTDEAVVRRAWDILKEDAEVYMELHETFFATAHGSLRDRFGINWMFTAEKEFGA